LRVIDCVNNSLILISERQRMADSNIAEELLNLLNSNESGLSDEQISGHFGARYGELVPILNDLLSMNRLQLFTQGGVLIYRLVREETAAKFEGLG
jgi:cytochrome c-type biogenesis protein CcmH/NrfF